MDTYDEKETPCPRCGGLGTIPVPNGEHNEVCPICGGGGQKAPEPYVVKWRS